jgi:hypothetical protein
MEHARATDQIRPLVYNVTALSDVCARFARQDLFSRQPSFAFQVGLLVLLITQVVAPGVIDFANASHTPFATLANGALRGLREAICHHTHAVRPFDAEP